jgi:hypothetical protein
MAGKKIDAEDARAGHTGDGVRYVLIASLALVVVSFVLIAAGVFG